MTRPDRQQPTFQSIFGESWNELPPVMHAHYANRPFSCDVNECRGTMSVKCAPLLRLVASLMHFAGGIPLANEDNIPVSVRFESDEDSPAFHFIRTFDLANRTPYVFHSRMVPLKDNEVAEIMAFRLCWRSRFSWQGGKVILSHSGFSLYLFNTFIPLPLTWLIGQIHAEEEPVSDTGFAMFVEIRHWLFGKIYEYRGRFEMVGTS